MRNGQAEFSLNDTIIALMGNTTMKRMRIRNAKQKGFTLTGISIILVLFVIPALLTPYLVMSLRELKIAREKRRLHSLRSLSPMAQLMIRDQVEQQILSRAGALQGAMLLSPTETGEGSFHRLVQQRIAAGQPPYTDAEALKLFHFGGTVAIPELGLWDARFDDPYVQRDFEEAQARFRRMNATASYKSVISAIVPVSDGNPDLVPYKYVGRVDCKYLVQEQFRGNAGSTGAAGDRKLEWVSNTGISANPKEPYDAGFARRYKVEDDPECKCDCPTPEGYHREFGGYDEAGTPICEVVADNSGAVPSTTPPSLGKAKWVPIEQIMNGTRNFKFIPGVGGFSEKYPDRPPTAGMRGPAMPPSDRVLGRYSSSFQFFYEVRFAKPGLDEQLPPPNADLWEGSLFPPTPTSSDGSCLIGATFTIKWDYVNGNEVGTTGLGGFVGYSTCSPKVTEVQGTRQEALLLAMGLTSTLARGARGSGSSGPRFNPNIPSNTPVPIIVDAGGLPPSLGKAQITFGVPNFSAQSRYLDVGKSNLR